MVISNQVMISLKGLDRKGKIGNAEIGAIAGLPGHMTEYRVWRRFSGMPEEDIENRDWVFSKSRILKDAIAELFTERTGCALRRSDSAYTDGDNPELIAFPDREATEIINDKRIALLCETAGSFSIKRSWGNLVPIASSVFPDADIFDGTEIPPQLYAECQWIYALGGYDALFVARLTDNEFWIYQVPENEKAETELYEMALGWLKEVRDGYVPEVTVPSDALLAYPKAEPGKDKEADEKMLKAYGELTAASRKKKEAEAEEKEARARMQLLMEDAESLSYGGRRLLTYRNERRSGFDLKGFRADYPDIAEDYTTVTETRTLRLPRTRG